MKFIILSVVYCRTNSKLFRTSAFHRWRWNRAAFSSNNFFTGQKNNYPFKTHLLSGQGTDCISWAQSVFPNMGFGWAERYNQNGPQSDSPAGASLVTVQSDWNPVWPQSAFPHNKENIVIKLKNLSHSLQVLILNIENQKLHFLTKYVRYEISVKTKNRLLKKQSTNIFPFWDF